MGSFIEINDTLQITREQGFPEELDVAKHFEKPFTAKDFEGRVFEFKDKKDIRIYHGRPVRTFLVENKDGKWIYWGHVYLTEVVHNMENRTTSGKFVIHYLFTPEEMKKAFTILDTRPDFDPHI